ncbi:MAG: TIGR00289 family protein [Methanobacteriaceae archaeon]|jgi:predicted ATP pyrophosphatase (TIGR00289 family)|nr:TIGR00289 family protein [Candidatus Methanorudis spinitermitis]
MKSAVLFSGGKDSVMALYKALENGDEVAYLLSIISENDESYMFHVPNIHLTDLIAEAIDIPIIKGYSKGKKEKELDDLEKQLSILKKNDVEAIYNGALYSKYQKRRIDDLCEKLGLKSIAPLWHVNEEDYMYEIINLGFEIIITGVSAEGLDKSWLGRKIDKVAIEELKAINKRYGINLAFEGGEAETLAIDGPIFKKRIKIIKAENQWNFDNGIFNIEDVVLEDK